MIIHLLMLMLVVKFDVVYSGRECWIGLFGCLCLIVDSANARPIVALTQICPTQLEIGNTSDEESP